MKKTGKEAKFLMRLIKGAELSRKQAKAQYKLGNPSATVHRLITQKNAAITREYVSRRINGSMRRIVKYSLA
jgi:hypothetical protein